MCHQLHYAINSLDVCVAYNIYDFMDFAIDVINRHGPSNEMCHQLQLEKDKVMLYYLFI